MSLLTDAAIPAVLGAVAIIFLFLMKGFLNFVFGVPIWLILMVVVAALTVAFIPTNILLGFWRYGKEGFVFMEARKKGVPVITDIEIGTGNAEYVLGVKVNPKDPLFEDDQSGVKMDPSLIAAYGDPLRFAGGLNIIGYAHDSLLPQNHKNHLAFKAIVEYLNPDIPNQPWMVLTHEEKVELSAFTTKEIIELIKKPEHFLEADVKTKLGKYFKPGTNESGKNLMDKNGNQVYVRQFQTAEGAWVEQTTLPDMILLIRKAKQDIDKLPISTGYFCMKEAFVNNPVAYTAQYASQLKSLLTQLAHLQEQKWQSFMQYGIIICGIMGMTIIGIYVLQAVVFK